LIASLFCDPPVNHCQSKIFIMALPPKWYQFAVSVFASLGSLLYGYDLGVIAEVIASGNFINQFGNDPNKM
jgi:hypothetical protein